MPQPTAIDQGHSNSKDTGQKWKKLEEKIKNKQKKHDPYLKFSHSREKVYQEKVISSLCETEFFNFKKWYVQEFLASHPQVGNSYTE